MACRGSGVQIPLAPLLEDTKKTERQARKTLTQLENHKLIIAKLAIFQLIVWMISVISILSLENSLYLSTSQLNYRF